MRDAALDAARNALLRLARQAHQSNEYFIAAFDGRARLLTDWTRDEAKFIKGLNDLARIEDRKSGTALYDALALATEKAARGSQPRRVVILVSDGRDNGSGTKASALREMLRRSGVVLYAVRVVDSNDAVPELDELARGSGGRALFPRTRAELDDSFERIALELHSLYTVGFKSDAADGRWHKLRVKVQPPPKWPRMSARTREGYYAAAAGGN
jgi:Ca-activated chloride channel family protein